MKQLAKLSFLASMAFFLFACNGGKNTEETSIATEETQTSKETQSTSVKIEALQKEGTLDVFTVKNIAYQANYMFNIELVGEFEVSGKLMFNEYEETTDFNVDETSHSQTKLLVDGSEYPIYTSLVFRNLPDLINKLNAEQKKAFAAGQEVTLRLNLKDPTAGCYMDKGRIGVASAEFISLN